MSEVSETEAGST